MSTQDDINKFTRSCNARSLLQIATNTFCETNDRMVQVPDVNSLPDLTNAQIDIGTILYVKNIDVPVVAQVGCWTGLDGKEIRNDYDNTVIWSWGSNSCNTLGIGIDSSIVSVTSPIQVIGGVTDWCSVSSGLRHSVALKRDGTAWSWGGNANGQLGTGDTTTQGSPVQVIGGFADWICVVTNREHNHGIRSNGTAWQWGSGQAGRLGDGTAITTLTSPRLVAGGFTDWCGIYPSEYGGMGIRTNGTLWQWGSGASGQIGDGAVVGRQSPVLVIGDFTDWCIAAGGQNTKMAIRTDGTLWQWGSNAGGILGDGTTVSRSSPGSVIGGFTDWCSVSLGRNFAVAIRQNGTIWAWGCGSFGRLGDGTTTDKSSPVQVIGGFTDWCQISTGFCHTLALRKNGTAWSWGSGTGGRLGNGSTISSASPVQVIGGFTDWCQVSSGTYHSTGIRKF